MKNTTVRTRTTIGTWTAILLAASMALAACGSDDGNSGDSSESSAEAVADSDDAEGDDSSGADDSSGGDDSSGADDSSGGDDSSGADDSSGGDDTAPPSSGGTVIFGGEEIPMQPLFCYFEEQPRVGLGGIFTHTAQAQGTNAAGEAVLLDTSRAVAEDGTVEDDLSFGVGDPFGDAYTEYYDTGQEVIFGDNSVSSNGDVEDFETGLVTLTFDLPCG